MARIRRYRGGFVGFRPTGPYASRISCRRGTAAGERFDVFRLIPPMRLHKFLQHHDAVQRGIDRDLVTGGQDQA